MLQSAVWLNVIFTCDRCVSPGGQIVFCLSSDMMGPHLRATSINTILADTVQNLCS